MRRISARSMPSVCSAADTTLPYGALQTTMPRREHASTSTLSTPSSTRASRSTTGSSRARAPPSPPSCSTTRDEPVVLREARVELGVRCLRQLVHLDASLAQVGEPLRRDRLDHEDAHVHPWIEKPPSTGMAAPVMKSD